MPALAKSHFPKTDKGLKVQTFRIRLPHKSPKVEKLGFGPLRNLKPYGPTVGALVLRVPGPRFDADGLHRLLIGPTGPCGDCAACFFGVEA